MQYRLKSRNRSIPNGFRFVQPETGWQPPNWASFDTIVRGVIMHRQGNPWLIKKNKLATDYNTVANEVENYNVKLCLAHGWMDWLAPGSDGGVDPKSMPPLHKGLGARLVAAGANLVSGAKTLHEWLGDDAVPVPITTAQSRAAICATCPQNSKGDLSSFFTVPAARKIRQHIEERTALKLSTDHDDALGVCEVCSCPLKLKVHTPLKYIVNNMNEATKASLPSHCWINNEQLLDAGNA